MARSDLIELKRIEIEIVNELWKMTSLLIIFKLITKEKRMMNSKLPTIRSFLFCDESNERLKALVIDFENLYLIL